MRKLMLKMSVSIDGFVGGPNGEIDWIFKSTDRGATDWIVKTIWQAGVHIMGSHTYQDMAAYWPSSTEPFAAPMNEVPKVIFTRKSALDSPSVERTTKAFREKFGHQYPGSMPSTPQTAAIERSWTHPGIASGDLTQEIGRLKREPGKDILAHGGAGFAQSLVASGLIDEYRLMIHSVALGSGLPLFSGLQKPAYLKLISAIPFDGGAVAHVYHAARD